MSNQNKYINDRFAKYVKDNSDSRSLFHSTSARQNSHCKTEIDDDEIYTVPKPASLMLLPKPNQRKEVL